MKSELELHDSTLAEVRREESGASIILDKAIVHHSEGQPGVDSGTCWLQTIEIHLSNAVIHKMPSDIPSEIDGGHFTINGQDFNNMISSSLVEEGAVEISMTTFHNQELRVSAKKIAIAEFGEAKYLQAFEGAKRT